MSSEPIKTPLLAVNEQLMAFRKKLEDVFKELRITLDVSIIAYTIAECTTGECNDELATLIRYHVMMGIDKQIQAVSRMIEALGGTTEYTEDTDDEKPS